MVCALSTDDSVKTQTTGHSVIACATIDAVIAIVAIGNIIARTSKQRVQTGAVAARQRVIASATSQ